MLADFGGEIDIEDLHTTPLGKAEFRENRINESNNFTQRPKHIFTSVEEIQQDATVCRYLFTAKLLYMFRVSNAPIIRIT